MFDAQQTPADFLLNTVTYGTLAAPFLAIRCLEQLASKHVCDYPQAAVALHQNTYVDYILVGADSVASTIALAQKVQKLLRFGCFGLSKWAAITYQLAAAICHSISTMPAALSDSTTALGVLRDPSLDILSIRMPSPFKEQHFTKANMLSYIASVYDPPGLLSLATIQGKLLMQCLRRLGIDWHTLAVHNIATHFLQYVHDLGSLSGFQVSR